MLMKKTGNTPFDADAALKAARLTVLALCSLWKSDIQESDRQEVVALAVAKAWARRDTFDPKRASLQTWVGRISRNTLLDHMRKQRFGGVASACGEDCGMAKAPDILMVEDESLERLMRVIASLPEPIQRVLTLLSEGKRPREIAAILGCTPNAAAIRCSRARRALREKLQEGE